MASVDVEGTAIGYRHEPGSRDLTFVFVNALTGSGAMWEADIAPRLRSRGFGSLTFDLPGQAESPVAADRPIRAQHLTDATAGVVRALAPSKPVFVGLSIGGLFALQAHVDGVPAAGFVLINTLRKADVRLAWINEAAARLAALGGGRLLRDAFGPLILGVDWQEANRDAVLGGAPYEGLADDSADLKLMRAGCEADWNVPYEQIRVPVVALTGLQDRVFYNPAHVAELAARLPDAVRQDEPNAAHMLPVEKPDAVVNACLAVAGRAGAA